METESLGIYRMNMLTKSIFMAVLLTVPAALATGPAAADPWKDESGNGNYERGYQYKEERKRDRHGYKYERQDANRGEGEGGRHAIGRGHYSHGKFCPPGLAKKGPSCIPPGHRKHHKHNKHWVRGDHIPHDVVYHRVYYDEYRLPRPQPGYFYASIGGDIYLLAEATKRVIEAINLVDTATR